MRKNHGGGCAFAAAYCEGLGLAAITVICGPSGVRITATAAGKGDGDRPDAAETVHSRFWCRRGSEAERVAAAAARIFRDESNDAACAAMAVMQAAKKRDIALFTEEAIAAEAQNVAARIDAEMQKQQASGGLKSVNKAYRDYRIKTSARGERLLRYDEWMMKYKENLVRQVASALR